jgi:hypothetical protein
MKIWFKVHKGDKLVAHAVVECEDDLSAQEFIEVVRKGCKAVDSPTPAVLDAHIDKFAKFGVTRFYPDDFVEKVDFTRLECEIMRRRK